MRAAEPANDNGLYGRHTVTGSPYEAVVSMSKYCGCPYRASPSPATVVRSIGGPPASGSRWVAPAVLTLKKLIVAGPAGSANSAVPLSPIGVFTSGRTTVQRYVSGVWSALP